MTFRRRQFSALGAFLFVATLLPLTAAPVAAESSATVPAGFSDDVVWSGLTDPTVVTFAPSGKVFVAQKDGRIQVFDSLTDTTPTQFADLHVDVHNYWDRGLLGLVADPDPNRPYVYALYTYDHILGDGGGAPKWGTGSLADGCPNPPGGNTSGCVVSGRLERLTVSGNTMSARKVLIEDWCQQFPSHSIGSVAFGPEGALYVSGGDGASFNQADYGQLGQSYYGSNPCGDPTNEGGALRSQDVRSTGDPTGLNGAILRVDPDTGDAWPDNHNAGSSDENKAKIIGFGLRNPFRMTVRADGSVWIGEVGYNTWEEINEIPDPDATPRNFGWPCFEGDGPQPDYQAFSLPLCDSLTSATDPEFTYKHADDMVSGDGCGHGSSAIAGLAFRGTLGNYPTHYDNGLFFTDYTRKCIWYAPPDGSGNPNFGARERFANLRRTSEASGGAVYLGITPNGSLIYTDLDRDEVRMITYDADTPPDAVFTATPDSGTAPLHVAFNASGSSDPDGDPLTYAWDLDGDGSYDDGSTKTISRTYTATGHVNVGLKVTAGGQSDTAHHVIAVGFTPPVAKIDSPASSLTWKVGDEIDFSGHGTDAQDGDLPDSAFEWTLKIEHCPSNCHEHTVQTWTGISSGSFDAPNHDYPSHLRLILRVTDSDGQVGSTHVDLQPKTGTVDASSDPAGIPLTVSEPIGIVGSTSDVSAPASAVLGEETWAFNHWSDGGARAHAATIDAGGNHLKASYVFDSSADASSSCSSSAMTSLGNAWGRGRLASGTDVDWYRFTVTSTRSYDLILANLPASARLSLYKGCSTLLASSDRAGTHTEEIVKSLPAGTYALKITSLGSSSDDPYTFRIRRLASGLSVLTGTSQIDTGAGRLTLVGEVWNEYSTTRGPVAITARIYDTNGKLLSTRHTETILYAKSHDRAPFTMTGTLPNGFYKVSYSVSASVSNKTPRNVSIKPTSFAEQDSRWRAKGTLKATAGPVKYLKMAMTLYDGFGHVIDVKRGTVPKTTLSTNASTTYDAWSGVKDLVIDRWALRAFGFKP